MLLPVTNALHYPFYTNFITEQAVPILVFQGLSALDLGPMYVTDVRQTDVHHRLIPLP